MAVEEYMKPTLRQIAREITSYIGEQGLGRSEFSLIGSWNERTDRVSIFLGTIQSVDEVKWYSDILTKLRTRFTEIGDPYAVWHIGLVVWVIPSKDEFYSHFRAVYDEADVTDFLESAMDAAWAEQHAAPAPSAPQGE